MAVKWTKQQSDAIDREGTLAVSAGAGSGKTAVLVEKLIRLISEHGADLDDILVVTFTKASAADVKEKITSSLYEIIASHPSSRHLQTQVTKVENASIDTIDAFCLKIVRRYFEQLDISCNFRMLDENESALIRDEVLEDCVDELYDLCCDDDFEYAVDQLCERRGDEGLKKAIRKIYNVLETSDDEDAFKKDSLDKLLPQNTYFEDIIKSDIEEQLMGAKFVYEAILNEVTQNCEKTEKLEEFFAELIEKICILISALNKDFYVFCRKLELFEFNKLYFPKTVDEELKNSIKQRHGTVKDSFDKMRRYSAFTREDVQRDKEDQRRILSFLYFAAEKFSQMLWERKVEMSAFDFSDIEKLALKLLTDNELRSSAALDIGAEYKYIFVDEYQDVNKLQDTIFRSIAGDNSALFIVGDVKQSIYGFRSADPELFANALAVDDALYLNANFRSRRRVLDSINYIFENVMTRETGGVDYDADHKLIFGSDSYDGTDDKDSELHVVAGGESEEFTHIARVIKKLLTEENYVYDKRGGKRRIELKDIAILMRSPKRSAANLEKVLIKQGIPAYSDTQPVFFNNEEIILATSMLSVIDNPTQDIMLASVLASPIGAFVGDELAEIRSAKKNCSLYEALKEYALHNEKAAGFVAKIEELRVLALSTSVAGILTRVYDEFNLLSVASSLGNAHLRKTNLRLLLEHATNFEKTGFKGIFNFNLYLHKIRESDREMSGAKAFSQDSNVVRIMSIHHSKGLEYPVVIVAQASKRYNVTDTREQFLVSKKYGAALELRDKEKAIRYNTAQSLCMEDLMGYDFVSEEIRLWYVAMTRAKERLIVTAACPKTSTGYRGISVLPVTEETVLGKWDIRRMSNPLSFIYNALQKAPKDELKQCDGIVIEHLKGLPWSIYYIDPQAVEKIPEAQLSTSDETIDESKVRKNLEFKYPYSRQKGFPSKTSISSIKRIIELKKDESASVGNAPEIKMQFSRPSFVMEDTKLSAAEKGTALHAFLQYADLGKLSTKADVESEIDRLLACEYITNIQARSLNIGKILSFGNSSTLKKALGSSEMQRERRFNIKVDVGFLCELTGEKLDCDPDSLVVMQGVVDCIYKDEGGYTIIDYKTDQNVTEKTLAQKYAPQLKLYAYAMKEITGCENIKCIIYSFYLEKEINV